MTKGPFAYSRAPSDRLKMPSSALIEDVSASVLIAREPEEHLPVPTRLVEQRSCLENARVLTVQVGERHSMDIFRASRGAIPICAAEGEAAIGNKVGGNSRLPAMRTVASTELLVTTPTTTRAL
jgi:hypothetical protein